MCIAITIKEKEGKKRKRGHGFEKRGAEQRREERRGEERRDGCMRGLGGNVLSPRKGKRKMV